MCVLQWPYKTLEAGASQYQRWEFVYEQLLQKKLSHDKICRIRPLFIRLDVHLAEMIIMLTSNVETSTAQYISGRCTMQPARCIQLLPTPALFFLLIMPVSSSCMLLRRSITLRGPPSTAIQHE